MANISRTKRELLQEAYDLINHPGLLMVSRNDTYRLMLRSGSDVHHAAYARANVLIHLANSLED